MYVLTILSVFVCVCVCVRVRACVEPGRSVMSARFRCPAGRSYNVRATELEREQHHAQVLCNVLLLDHSMQPFTVSVGTTHTHTHTHTHIP